MVKATNATDLLLATDPCEILYSKKAWMKVALLVGNRNQEVGWHGVVRRSKKPDKFIVDDILVFPQSVTATSVTPNTEDYTNWQDSLDVETFNSIRMHGHSHVNMGVSPSSTDKRYRSDLLTAIDDFYIFQIFNKKGRVSSQVYDVLGGVLYESNQVKIKLERFSPITYDLCKTIFNNVSQFRQTDIYDLQDGIEWIMDTASEFEEFMEDADKIIDERPDWRDGKMLIK